MSYEFFTGCILESMKRANKAPDFDQYSLGDFIHAAAQINTLDDALWFAEGAYEDEAWRIGAKHTQEAIEGARSLILQAVNTLED